MPDTRPRITFDENGICDACQWAEKKKNIDLDSRRKELELLLDKYRSKNASLDDATDEFHYYLEWIKFGFCRTTSGACHEIRDGQMTREKGVELAKKHDGVFPPKESFKEFLEYLDITEKEFWEVIEKFRSHDVWEKVNGEWKKKVPLI